MNFLKRLPVKSHRHMCRTSAAVSVPQQHSTKPIDEASLYIHWPYCRKRCSYCNFNKYVSSSVDQDRMIQCMSIEARSLIAMSGVSKITSVFFGGGTPSLADPRLVMEVLACIHETATLDKGAEVTLEVNPTQMETDKLLLFKNAGINRLSLGIQTLDKEALVLLGREHSADDAKRSIVRAKELLPGHVSVDVMFGWMGQTLEQWRHELLQILSLCDNHISLYQLTLERGTELFKKVDKGFLQPTSLELMADMYEECVELLETHGFERYEVSNFARTAEARSSHNLSYWTGGQYIGIGPGAHGRFTPTATAEGAGQDVPGTREARIQTLEPEPWMREVEAKGHGTRRHVPLSTLDLLQERLMLGLRTATGITQQSWSECGASESLVDTFTTDPSIQEFIANGYLQLQPGCLRATRSGLALCDHITPYLLNRVQHVEAGIG